MLKIKLISIPNAIFVVAKIHTPPIKLKAAHTAYIIKNT